MHGKLEANRWVVAWQRYWFTPGSADTLAFARITCCALCFLIYLDVDIRPWAAVSPVFWKPVSLFHLLSGEPQRPAFLGLLQTLWKVSLVTSAVGLATRASLITAALLGYFVLGLPNCFGKIHHLDGFAILLLLILSVSACDRVFTIDRIFWKGPPPSARLSGTYTWPIRLAQILFLLIFFAAGLSKLRHGGAAWIHPENMRFLLLGNFFTHTPRTQWAAWIARSDALCSLAATVTVGLELAALPAIFLPQFRTALLIALLILQAFISFVMGIYFIPYLVGYSLFVPWGRLRRRSIPMTR